ncbi:hypothetical protein [Streptomyces youssoufiensis]
MVSTTANTTHSAEAATATHIVAIPLSLHLPPPRTLVTPAAD